ncbi:hypothetical protein KBX29_03950 [Corynebacterium sp. CCUG 18816]|uniref:hypothetical protein n=1 Tax=Corynebacterium pseudogenitalium TaxID=38303 RepID=UPI00210D0F82|nr:hypothetical protein [Corynebacterium pseudogenitalium]MCQ4616000.1 hypothetical protein [Corynebacterium pseudogenitalium]
MAAPVATRSSTVVFAQRGQLVQGAVDVHDRRPKVADGGRRYVLECCGLLYPGDCLLQDCFRPRQRVPGLLC